MEGELACEELKAQCTCKKNGVRPIPALRFFSCPRILAHAFVESYGCKERKDGHPARMVRPPVRFLFVPNWDKNSNFLRSAVTKTGDPLRIESHRLAVVEGVASGYLPPPAKRSSGLVSH
jgi:hypothetical protein